MMTWSHQNVVQFFLSLIFLLKYNNWHNDNNIMLRANFFIIIFFFLQLFKSNCLSFGMWLSFTCNETNTVLKFFSIGLFIFLYFF